MNVLRGRTNQVHNGVAVDGKVFVFFFVWLRFVWR